MRFFLAIAAGSVEKATKEQATSGRFVEGNRLQEATSAHQRGARDHQPMGVSAPRHVLGHNAAVVNSGSPAPSEMDTALLDAVGAALNEHPDGVATITHTWVEEAGMWFVRVSPRLPSAADFSIAYDGDDLLNVTVGNIWFEIFPITSVEELDYAREIAVAVFAGRVEESGPPGKAFGRIHLKEGPVGIGSVRIPWPWRARPVQRHYDAYR